MAFPTGWTSKQKLTIDYTKVSGGADLSNFPVLITESNLLSSIFTNALTTGADIRFSSDVSGSTQLAFEIVNFDTVNSKAEIFVKIPTVSYTANTVFYVWYGKSDATALDRTDTYGSDNVWDANYIGVWHLNNGTGSSTSDARSLTATGSPTYTTGKISSGSSGAMDFEADNTQYATNTNSAYNLTGDYTVESLFKAETMAFTNLVCGVVTDGNTYGALYNLRIGAGAGTNKLNGNTWASSGSFLDVTGGTTIAAGTWYHGAFVKDADNDWKLYLNGSQDASSSDTRTLSATGKSGIRIGANEGSSGSSNPNGGYFDGIQDEVRISNSARTAGWLATQWNNFNSPSTFITEEAATATTSSSTTTSSTTSSSTSSTSSSTSTSTSTSTTTSSSTSSSSTTTYLTSNKVYSKGDYSVLLSDDTDLENTFTYGEYIDVGSDNGVRVVQTSNTEKAVFLFKDYVPEDVTSISVSWNGQTDRNPELNSVTLQVFNYDSDTWETKDFYVTNTTNTDFTISSTISSNISNYIDPSRYMAWRVWQ